LKNIDEKPSKEHFLKSLLCNLSSAIVFQIFVMKPCSCFLLLIATQNPTLPTYDTGHSIPFKPTTSTSKRGEQPLDQY